MLRKVILSLAAVLSLVSFTWANYATEVAADNPIMWLRFDDYRYNNDRTATDITGNVDQATYQGDTVIVAAGIDGTAGLFNGYISAVDLASQLGPMLNGVDAITFEAWVRNSYLQSGTSQQRIFATRISGGAGHGCGHWFLHRHHRLCSHSGPQPRPRILILVPMLISITKTNGPIWSA